MIVQIFIAVGAVCLTGVAVHEASDLIKEVFDM